MIYSQVMEYLIDLMPATQVNVEGHELSELEVSWVQTIVLQQSDEFVRQHFNNITDIVKT